MVAVVLVVALILGLSFAGIIPLFPSSTPPSGPVSYATASSEVATAAGSHSGGPWSIVVGAAVNTQTHLTQNFNGVGGGSGCIYTPISIAPGAALTLPAFSGSVGQGISPGWLFFLKNSSNALLIAAVLNASASLVGTLTGTCATGLSIISQIPSDALDSTSATANANSAGGSAFLAAHPTSNSSYFIFGGATISGFLTIPPLWEVIYSTCPVNVTAAVPGFQFNATMNAITGAIMGKQSISVTCAAGWAFQGLGVGITPPGPTPIGTALALGYPAETPVGGKFWYNFSIQSAGGGIVANNLQFQVLTSTGAIVPAASLTSINLLNIVGTSVGTYSFASSSWTVGGTTPLNSQQTLALLSTSSLSGDTLVVSGVGSFTGSISVGIP